MAIQDSGSNYQFYDKRIFDHVPRSFFDESHLVTQSADFGKVYVIDWDELLPNEDWTCKLQTLVKMLPAVVAPLSRMRVFFHLYTMDYNQMWKHWEAFMKKGHDGKGVWNLPTVHFPDDYVVKAGDLCDMIGIPQGLTGSYLNSVGILAFPFMMYQSICKHYYINPVLDYIDNKNIFPDDDDEWRLKDGQNQTIPTVDISKETWNLYDVHWRNYVDDYFTSAMTSPMRGDVPYIDIGAASSSSGNLSGQFTAQVPSMVIRNTWNGGSGYNSPAVDSTSSQTINALGTGDAALTNSVNVTSSIEAGSTLYRKTDGSIGSARTQKIASSSSGSNARLTRSLGSLSQSTPATNISGSVTVSGEDLVIRGIITHDQIRGLAIATSILETMARTDGSYTQFIQQFFRNSPNSRDLKPRYVGGSYAPIIVNEVLQTSATGDSTPQGHGAGRGISSTDNFLGKFHSNDFGMYMLCMTIMPDTYYHQGIDRKLLRKTQEEYPLPPRAKLGPQEIMNAELYNTNDMPVNDEKNGAFGLFGFQNRYDEYRYRQNVVKGHVADRNMLDMYALTQMRDFGALPTLSNSFVTTKGNINKMFMVAQDMDSFQVQVACRFGAVRPLPYKAVPADFID